MKLRKNTRKEIPFYPDHMFKEGIVALFVLAVVMLMATFLQVPNEPVANPTDTSYIPRPEWYFLFLFQALKYFSGPTEMLGTFLLPVVFILILVLLPFYDRKAEKKWRKRPIAISAATLILIGIIVLTFQAGLVSTITLFASPAHGKQIYADKGCDICHTLTGATTEGAPDLLHVGSRLEPEYIFNHFKDPEAYVKDSSMPKTRDLSDQDLKDLTAYMMSLK
ncbi:MAG: c-type cytochrome [Ruminiclostridium sp.]|nr:c-type cytochrome [Ruminiclostridium sp.]